MILVVAVALILLAPKTISHFKYVRTHDTFGKILVTLDKTLSPDSGKQYDVAKETKERFPSVVVKDGKIIDGWGHPIEVSIKETNDRFDVQMKSPGADGIINTKDDVIREESVMALPIPLSSPGSSQ